MNEVLDLCLSFLVEILHVTEFGVTGKQEGMRAPKMNCGVTD